MAYYLTPAERRARAQNLVQQRKNVVAYKQYLQQQRDYEKQVAQAKLDEENRQKKIDSMNFFTRAVSTVGDLAANVITGALKGLEGIYDLGVGITGAIGGIFSKEFQDTMQKHIATDWVGTYIGDPLQELTKFSYTKNGGIIEGVASGIGQMLPAVIVSVATAGAGAPAAIAEMASLATLGVSAAGNSTEEAYQDGASYYAGLGYGLASGAVEVATEKMFGGFGKLTGAGYLDNVTRSIAKQGAARVAKEFVEEGVEEVVSELANPALKAIYKGSEALEEYKDPEYWKGVGEAGLIGGLTSVAYGQSIGRVMHTSGRYADVSEARQEYETLRQKALNLEENGRIDEVTKNGKTNRQNLYESKMENIRLIENTIKKVDESRREKFIKRAGLEGMFNTDGSVNSEYAAREGLWGLVEQSTAEGDGKPVRPLASQPERYRTAFADEGAMQEALEGGRTTAFEGEMTPEQARDFDDFKKAFGKIANKSEGYLKFIVSNPMESNNAYFDPNTGVIVIGADQFGKGTSGVETANAIITSDMWQSSLIHEVRHSTEGTKAGAKLNEKLFTGVNSEGVSLLEESIDSYAGRYLKERFGGDVDKASKYVVDLFKRISEATSEKPKSVSVNDFLTDKGFTKQEVADYFEAQSEISAIAAENVLGNEEFIKKLIRDETNLAQKLLNRIADMGEAFSSFKSKDSRAAYTYLQKAEKLYLKAIEEAGGHFSKGRIIGIRQPERDEGIDSNGEMQYNENVSPVQESKKSKLIGGTFPSYKEGRGTQANELATRWAHREDIQVGDRTTISFNDKWYLIEKFGDSDWGYQIIAQMTEEQYQEYTEDRKNVAERQSIQKSVSEITSINRRASSADGGVVSDDSLSSRNGEGNSEVQRVGQEQPQRGQTQRNGDGDSESRRSSKQGLRYSLKENIEEEVVKRYGKTYRWSEAGYLLKDGTRVDMSGRNEGAPGGNRTIDHRDIFYDISGDYGTDAMVEFMSRGNIRVIPEYPGINLQVEPTEAQYKQIQSLVETLGWKKKEFSVDFDNAKGDTIDSLNYEGNVSARKVVEDIKYFFKEGKIPYQSELSRFRYSRKDSQGRTLSDGQIKKLLANSTHYKVYSKADAEKIINNVLAQYLSFGERYGDISGKTKAEVIDLLWKGLNSAEPGKQMGIALHIADYIIQNSVMEEVSSYDSEVQWAIDIIDALKPYLHSINLDYIKGEIKYRYDRDNSPYLLWGKRKGDSGYGADQIAMELEERGIFIDAINEADIFFEIDTQYRNAVRALKKKAKDSLAEVLPKDQLKELRQQIAREVLRGFDYAGESSKLSKILDQYKKQISTLYERLRDAKRHNNATNRLLDKVQKIRNWKTGAFVNASKYRPKLFQRSIERLGLIKNRGNLNQSGTRRILAGLAEWYVKDNPVLGYTDSEHTGYYNEEIAAILQAVSQNQKPLTDEQIDLISYLQEKSGITDYKGLLEWYTKENLKKAYSPEVKRLLRELASETTFTTEELIALDKAVGYFGNLIENYNKVIRNGKYVDAKPIAEGYIETFKANKQVKVGWIGKLFDKVFNNGKASYLQTFADPMTVARYMDKYAQGFYTEMLSELRNGTIKAGIMEMNIRSSLDEFLKKHKQYAKGVSRRTVTYRGAAMPALDALYLYMTLNRDQALAGLAEAGFTFNNGKEQIRVDGFAKGSEGLTLDELRSLAKEEQDSLYKQFTEEDKEYITIAESVMETCKEVKRETDMLRLGYSNVIEGYYVPIRRANGAITVDSNSTFFDEMNRVSNASFNKDTVRGAKGELYIEGLDEVLDRHIHGISQYSTLATVIDQYDILYNLNMTEDANKPTTVRTESENVWAKGNDYFKKLISDIQGISPTRGGGSKLFGFFRSNYAKYQLGLNPKVWVTQLSSLFASSSILDYSSIVRGFSIKTPDVDEYCNLAALRNNENSAAMAQGVLESVGKFGDMLMKPIGAVDRFVVKRLFGACQVQVQKNSGLKIGTKENKVKAGELLERVILETQQNALATERSAAMRSGSEMMKTLTMFTADSMKVFGRVVDSLGEVAVLKHKIQATTDADTKAQLQAQLKQANKRARKSITALASAAIFMALVAQAFRWLYGKDDDDDENAIATMAVDAVGNLMGGLPLIKDLYAKLTEGYELQNYSYSAINDLFDAFAGIVNFSEGKPAKKVKDIVFSVGQLFGIPTRNLYNILYGLTKRLSPTTAYEIDNVFYNKNYSSDLKKAIENDDEDMIATIAGLMLDERVGDIESESARKELNRLVSSGYEVLPRSVNNSITYNGEETALTDRQREQFKKVYSGANSELASLVTSKAYTSASDEVKAKAVNFVYDIYYNLAIEDLLGVDLETKNILFAKAVDISSLAIIVATARNFEADTDRRGNVISGSKKAKVQGYINSLGLRAAQKYMIMGYLGYSNKNGERQVRSYIQTLRLSKTEKEKLFEYSGYAA